MFGLARMWVRNESLIKNILFFALAKKNLYNWRRKFEWIIQRSLSVTVNAYFQTDFSKDAFVVDELLFFALLGFASHFRNYRVTSIELPSRKSSAVNNVSVSELRLDFVFNFFCICIIINGIDIKHDSIMNALDMKQGVWNWTQLSYY